MKVIVRLYSEKNKEGKRKYLGGKTFNTTPEIIWRRLSVK